MLIDQILVQAKPLLKDRTITDAVLSLSLIAVELDNGDLGLSYMLRDGLPPGCSTFGFAQELIGQNAWTAAQLAVEGTDNAQRGVGMAVLTAGSCQLPLPDEDPADLFFGIDLQEGDVIGMIGLIPPVAKRFRESGHQTIVFDEEISHFGASPGDVYPMADQSKLLPTCDVVVLSGTTMINQSLTQLLEWSCNAREIIMVGSSTPMYPEAFKGSGVTVLAGSWWDVAKKDILFKKISLAGGIRHISDIMIKKCVRVDQ